MKVFLQYDVADLPEVRPLAKFLSNDLLPNELIFINQNTKPTLGYVRSQIIMSDVFLITAPYEKPAASMCSKELDIILLQKSLRKISIINLVLRGSADSFCSR